MQLALFVRQDHMPNDNNAVLVDKTTRKRWREILFMADVINLKFISVRLMTTKTAEDPTVLPTTITTWQCEQNSPRKQTAQESLSVSPASIGLVWFE